MDDKLQEIQRNIDSTEAAIQAGGVSVGQIDVWNGQLAEFKVQYAARTAELQAMDSQLADAKENGYIFAGLKNGDYSMAELAYDADSFTLQCIAVQTYAIEQKDANDRKNAELDQANEDINKRLYQANIDNADLAAKLKNATDIIAEKETEITALKANQAIPTTVIAPLTAEEQDAQWKALNAMKNNRIKVTNIRFADATGVDTRNSIATLALGGEVEFDTTYKSRYVIISEEEATQLRAEYEQKKADIEASNSIVPLDPVESVLEVPEQPAVSQDDFRNTDTTTEQSPVALEGENNTQSTGGENADTTVQASTVITLESLQAQIDQIKSHVGLVAA